MKIGAFQKFSMLDFPHILSAVVFTQGCNYRCSYCHNPELVYPELFSDVISEKSILEFLSLRKGKLEGVVITGGEPTIHDDLGEFLKNIKKTGYKIKLDTNGTNPDMLNEFIRKRLIDYFAMDIKAPLSKYPLVTGMSVPVSSITESIKLIMNSGIDYEFRTTVDKSILTENDIKEISEMIINSDRYFLQKLRIPDKLKSENSTSYKLDSDLADYSVFKYCDIKEFGIR